MEFVHVIGQLAEDKNGRWNGHSLCCPRVFSSTSLYVLREQVVFTLCLELRDRVYSGFFLSVIYVKCIYDFYKAYETTLSFKVVRPH